MIRITTPADDLFEILSSRVEEASCLFEKDGPAIRGSLECAEVLISKYSDTVSGLLSDFTVTVQQLESLQHNQVLIEKGERLESLPSREAVNRAIDAWSQSERAIGNSIDVVADTGRRLRPQGCDLFVAYPNATDAVLSVVALCRQIGSEAGRDHGIEG